MLPSPWLADSLGNYSATWQPGATSSQMIVTMNAASGSLQPATAKLFGGIAVNQTPPPTLAQGGTLNNLNPVVGGALAPGMIAEVFGTNLAATAGSTGMLPLPTNFNNTFAQVGPLQGAAVFPQQRTGQRPDSGRDHRHATSPHRAQCQQRAYSAGDAERRAERPRRIVDVRRSQSTQRPEWRSHHRATLERNRRYHGQSRQTRRVSGDVSGRPRSNGSAVASGMPAPAMPLSNVTVKPIVTVDSQPSDVFFAGLTPGFVGLYQIDFQVPSGVHTGDVVVTVTQNGIAANPTLLAVSQ